MTSSTNRAAGAVLMRIAQRLIAPATGARGDLLRLFGLDAFGIVLGVVGPVLLKRLLDALSARRPAEIAALGLVGAYVLAWALASLLVSARGVVSMRLVDRLTSSLAVEGARGALVDLATGEGSDSGRVMGVLERLPYSLMLVIDGVLGRLAPVSIQIVASAILMMTLLPWPFVVGLLVLWLVFFAVSWLAWRRHAEAVAPAHTEALAGSQNLADVLRNARRVVFNGAIDLEMEELSRRYAVRRVANEGMTRSLFKLAGLQYAVVGAGLLCLWGLAAREVLAGPMTVSDFVLLQTYCLALIAPLNGLTFVLAQAGLAIANLADGLAIAVTPAPHVSPDAKPVERAADVVVRDLAFRYPDGRRAIDGVSLSLPAGSFTAIVGRNGSGKSTLAKLMAGLLTPEAGTVSIGGLDLTDVPPAQRWRHVLYVPQFISLFHRSLRDNALYPPTTLKEADLQHYLQIWGFDTNGDIDMTALAGEQGARLSGGQVQKLELARILGVQTPVIILDESTSALDPASEATLLAALLSPPVRTTWVMVTHHRLVVERADRVVFVDGGRLTGLGEHNSLMQTDLAYQALWRGGDELADSSS